MNVEIYGGNHDYGVPWVFSIKACPHLRDFSKEDESWQRADRQPAENSVRTSEYFS
jgi:hypothetical protein